MDKPRVKPLEWDEDPRAGWKRGRIVGLSPRGKTEATIFRVECGWQYMGDVYAADDSLDAALDCAKAAAQADYEARILAALEPQTVQEALANVPTFDLLQEMMRRSEGALERNRALAERGE